MAGAVGDQQSRFYLIGLESDSARTSRSWIEHVQATTDVEKSDSQSSGFPPSGKNIHAVINISGVGITFDNRFLATTSMHGGDV